MILLRVIVLVLTAPVWVALGLLWLVWQLIRDAFAEEE